MDIEFLKGKKIGITALDLEQIEHRGIAAVTKSLIQLLNKYGAEIYLITGLGSRRSGIFVKRFMTRKLLSEIYIKSSEKTAQAAFLEHITGIFKAKASNKTLGRPSNFEDNNNISDLLISGYGLLILLLILTILFKLFLLK